MKLFQEESIQLSVKKDAGCSQSAVSKRETCRSTKEEVKASGMKPRHNLTVLDKEMVLQL